MKLNQSRAKQLYRILYAALSYLTIWLVVMPCLVLVSLGISLVNKMNPKVIIKTIINGWSLNVFLPSESYKIKEYIKTGKPL